MREPTQMDLLTHILAWSNPFLPPSPLGPVARWSGRDTSTGTAITVTQPRTRHAPGLCAALLPGHTVPAALTDADEFELRAATTAAVHGRVRTWDADWNCTYDSSRVAAAGGPTTRIATEQQFPLPRGLRAGRAMDVAIRHARLQAEYIAAALAEEDR